MSHKIYSIEQGKDYCIDVVFYNGEKRRCNFKALLETHYEEDIAKRALKYLSKISIQLSKNGIVLTEGVIVDSDKIWGNSYSVGTNMIDDPAIMLADLLIDIRECAGISQRELEKRSGIKQTQISKIERGEANPSLKTISRLFASMGRVVYITDAREVKKHKASDFPVVTDSVARYLDPAKQQGEYTIDDIERLPDGIMSELIDGIIYDFSVPSLAHQMVIQEIFKAFSRYIDDNAGKCKAFMGPTGVWFEEDNNDLLIPDMFVVCDETKLQKKGVVGAPDFVLEVLSDSTRSRDLNVKLNKYRAKGVKEYWIVDLKNQKLIVHDWAHTDIPVIYGMGDLVLVGIYDGALKIDMGKVVKNLE